MSFVWCKTATTEARINTLREDGTAWWGNWCARRPTWPSDLWPSQPSGRGWLISASHSWLWAYLLWSRSLWSKLPVYLVSWTRCPRKFGWVSDTNTPWESEEIVINGGRVCVSISRWVLSWAMWALVLSCTLWRAFLRMSGASCDDRRQMPQPSNRRASLGAPPSANRSLSSLQFRLMNSVCSTPSGIPWPPSCSRDAIWHLPPLPEELQPPYGGSSPSFLYPRTPLIWLLFSPWSGWWLPSSRRRTWPCKRMCSTEPCCTAPLGTFSGWVLMWAFFVSSALKTRIHSSALKSGCTTRCGSTWMPIPICRFTPTTRVSDAFEHPRESMPYCWSPRRTSTWMPGLPATPWKWVAISIPKDSAWPRQLDRHWGEWGCSTRLDFHF